MTRRSMHLICLFTCAVMPAGLWPTNPQPQQPSLHDITSLLHLNCPASVYTLAWLPRSGQSQMGQHLAKAEAKSHGPDSSGLQELSESVYTDVLDRTCSQNWQSYGVQEVNGMKRLMGPGLSKGTEPSISVMITGGPWPNRLSTMCFEYLGEFGEDQIYEAHLQGHEALEALLCGGSQGSCSLENPREEL
ncbi:marginal zone B- and B1-cell-specific protein isoform X2 [Alexandromys fortis]|uniref:marginal zone B- and B1-cell-specific protein isoform X2 n=1 Tax=Alexandromys fortis TaxID=100897 RepID=UPI0021537C4E|nr:marginal zone B- and B1-cell-specific protein isoform X2 [Microtus fortis]